LVPIPKKRAARRKKASIDAEKKEREGKSFWHTREVKKKRPEISHLIKNTDDVYL